MGDTTIKIRSQERKNMEFLKSILGDELYNTVAEKINAYNGNEANKDNLIKIANLATGEYVGKGKYDALNELLTSKQTELDGANNLIAELKAGTKGNDELQGKITTYETVTIPKLQEELAETKLKSAIKVALLSEKAVDVDYLTYKLREKGEKLELDDNDNIKNWDDISSGLKTQFPTMFSGSATKKVVENKLDGGKEDKGFTKAELLKMPYSERARIFNENPKLFEKEGN